MKILIKNGHLVDPANSIDDKRDILIDDGKIVQVRRNILYEDNDDIHLINASGNIVIPGLIDMHVHLREPGREDKETVATCTRAAAKGGFTGIVGMPNTTPVGDDQTVISYVYEKARKEGIVNVWAVGNITKQGKGNELAQVGDLVKAGAIAVSDDGSDIRNAVVMKRALEYLQKWGIPLISHSEDADLAGEWAMHEGSISTRLGLPGKPEAAEDVMISRQILLSEATGSPVHFTHVNTIIGLELIKAAKKRKAKVSCDTCPHYFTLTDEAVIGYNPNAKMNPPLRPKEHVDSVIKALKEDVIDCITTDHAPHLLVEKYREFEECENGIVGLETSVPLVMDRLVNKKIISLNQMVRMMSWNPARILKLNKGTLSVGTDADVTIIDPKLVLEVDKDSFESKGKNTPFNGWKLKGWPVTTIVSGKIIYDHGKFVDYNEQHERIVP
ncbi:amidohydrolase family protein [Candidatus Woesearchaeota archaeon]|nr:amidohydrolase family protein [Candidatus Woesearchaeota archaeon]